MGLGQTVFTTYLMDLDISVCLDNMLTSTAIGHHHHIKQGVHQKLVFSSIQIQPMFTIFAI